jgi:hypothetical protein
VISASGSSSGLNADQPSELEWDVCPPNSSIPYAWDRPQSGEKTLMIEFSQHETGVGDWAGLEMPLDKLASKDRIKLQRNIPHVQENSIEGYIERQDVLLGIWSRVYAVLIQDVIYLFDSEGKKVKKYRLKK